MSLRHPVYASLCTLVVYRAVYASLCTRVVYPGGICPLLLRFVGGYPALGGVPRRLPPPASLLASSSASSILHIYQLYAQKGDISGPRTGLPRAPTRFTVGRYWDHAGKSTPYPPWVCLPTYTLVCMPPCTRVGVPPCTCPGVYLRVYHTEHPLHPSSRHFCSRC